MNKQMLILIIAIAAFVLLSSGVAIGWAISEGDEKEKFRKKCPILFNLDSWYMWLNSELVSPQAKAYAIDFMLETHHLEMTVHCAQMMVKGQNDGVLWDDEDLAVSRFLQLTNFSQVLYLNKAIQENVYIEGLLGSRSFGTIAYEYFEERHFKAVREHYLTLLNAFPYKDFVEDITF